jgi:hypothetical protein
MLYPGLDASHSIADRVRVTPAGWIVCRSRPRLVSSGLVGCPAGRMTSIDDCLACRFLEAVEDDRDVAYGCATWSTADAAASAPRRDDVPPTPFELAVDLL